MSYPVVVTDRRPQPVHAVIAWVVAVLTVLYMLPWAIAATRGKSTALVIGVVNFLLGWTVIGWIAALVWACTSHRVLSGGLVAPVAVAPPAIAPGPSNSTGPTYSRAYGPPGYSAQPFPPPPPTTGPSYGQPAPGKPPYPPPPALPRS